MQTNDQEKRIATLERDMSFLAEKIDRVSSNISDLRSEMKMGFHQVSDLETRLYAFQIKTDERFIEIHRDMRTGFTGIYREMGAGFTLVESKFADIHKSISIQTKWTLAAILASATLISVASPIMETLLK